MTGSLWLDGAILLTSIFNTILLFWLGLMVLLNAERRTWGVLLSSGAMLLGGVFFLSHTAIIGYSPSLSHPDIEMWWRAGWIPITCLPFAWYTVMLWYSGYWEAASALRLRHRRWFNIMLAWALIFLIMLIFTHPLPSIAQVLNFDFSASPAIYGMPVLIVLYPLYTVFCTGLTLDVLRWPGPSQRALAELARQRAWPWLAAASLALFVASLLVGGTVFWIVTLARDSAIEPGMTLAVGILDLLIAALIGVAILLTGQAIVSYEVFTGISLPRGGLRRAWRRAILLASGFGLVISLAIQLDPRPINILLVALLLVTVFFALMSWRAFGERELVMDSLRPFLANQDLYAELVSQMERPVNPGATENAGEAAFYALCVDVLDTSLAYLVPLGPMAPLVGSMLTFPKSANINLQISMNIPKAFEQISSPATRIHGSPSLHTTVSLAAIDPSQYGGASWLIPLYGKRGLIGMLLLGEKRDLGLFTQEEVEIAQLGGERLLDALASAEIARRLMTLQRQRVAESKVVDHQVRRKLHDDILPQLHTEMLNLSDSSHSPDLNSITAGLAALHAQIADLLRAMPPAPETQLAQIGLAAALRQLIEQEHRSDFNQTCFEITDQALACTSALPLVSSEVVYYAVREAVRNAVRYGRGHTPDRELCLSVQVACEKDLTVSVEDNGVGAPPYDDRSRFTGSGTPQHAAVGGSGQGLALHSTLLAVLGGTLDIYQNPGGGTKAIIRLPIELTH
jgi:signal transduction histidine kinase